MGYVSFLEGNIFTPTCSYLSNKKISEAHLLGLGDSQQQSYQIAYWPGISILSDSTCLKTRSDGWVLPEKGKTQITGLQNAQRSWEFRNIGQIEHVLRYLNYEVSGRTKTSLQKGDACSWHIPWLFDYQRLMLVHVADGTTKKHQKPIHFIPVPVFPFEKLLWLVNLGGGQIASLII